jgi:hypothetical protein
MRLWLTQAVRRTCDPFINLSLVDDILVQRTPLRRVSEAAQ